MELSDATLALAWMGQEAYGPFTTGHDETPPDPSINRALAIAASVWRSDTLSFTYHPSYGGENVFYENFERISGGEEYVYGAIGYEPPPSFDDLAPDAISFNNVSGPGGNPATQITYYKSTATTGTFPDGWPGVRTEIFLAVARYDNNGKFLFYTGLGSIAQQYGPQQAFIYVTGVDVPSRIYHYRVIGVKYNPFPVGSEAFGWRDGDGHNHIAYGIRFLNNDPNNFSDGTEISVGGDTISAGGYDTISIDTRNYPEGTEVKIRALGDGSRASNWTTLWHRPLAWFDFVYEDGELSLNATDSFGFESPIVQWQWQIAGLFTYELTGKTLTVDWQEIVDSHPDITLPNGTFFLIYLTVTNARGETSLSLGRFTYQENSSGIGLLADHLGFVLAAKNGVSGLDIVRHNGQGPTPLATLSDYAAPKLFPNTQSAAYWLLAKHKTLNQWQLLQSRNGQTWALMSTPFDASTFKAADGCQTHDGFLLAAAIEKSSGGLIVRLSGDGGATWNTRNAPAGTHKTVSLDAARDGSARVFLLTDATLQQTADLAEYWQAVP